MKFSLSSLVVGTFLSFPIFVFASTYAALQPINLPSGEPLGNANILQYLANIYTFGIAVAGGLAVIKIVYSGIKYMLSDIVTDKGEAKKSIEAAVYGLLMALGSFVFLYTLNPNLVRFNLNINQTGPMTGSGADLITGPLINSTVSGGKPSTPGVNNPPTGTSGGNAGAEIEPPLPESGGDNSDMGDLLLPPKPGGENTPLEQTGPPAPSAQTYTDNQSSFPTIEPAPDGAVFTPSSDKPFTADQIPKLP